MTVQSTVSCSDTRRLSVFPEKAQPGICSSNPAGLETNAIVHKI